MRSACVHGESAQRGQVGAAVSTRCRCVANDESQAFRRLLTTFMLVDAARAALEVGEGDQSVRCETRKVQIDERSPETSSPRDAEVRREQMIPDSGD